MPFIVYVRKIQKIFLPLIFLTLLCLGLVNKPKIVEANETAVFFNDKNKQLKVRDMKKIEGRDDLFSAIDITNGSKLMIRKISNVSANNHPRLEFEFLQQKGNPLFMDVYDQILLGKIYRRVQDDQSAQYIVSPYIEGVTYGNYYASFSEHTADKKYELSKNASGFLSHIIEVGKIIRGLYSAGFMIRDLNKDILYIQNENSEIFIREFEGIERLNGIEDLQENFIDILCLFYPLEGNLDVVNDYKTANIYLKIVEEEAVNKQLNDMLAVIAKKIEDYSYFYDKELLTFFGFDKQAALLALDEFLVDINNVAKLVESKELSAPANEGQFLSDKEINMFYSNLQQEIGCRFKYRQVYDDVNVKERKLRMSFLKIPLVVNPFEDLIVLSPKFTLADFDKMIEWQLKRAASLYDKHKEGVAIVYSADDFDDHQVRRRFIRYLRNFSIRRRSHRFIKIENPFPLMFREHNDLPRFQQPIFTDGGEMAEYEQSEVIEFVNKDQEIVKFRFEKYLAKYNVLKGTAVETGEDMVVKAVNSYEAQLHRYFDRLLTEEQSEHLKDSWFDHLLISKIYKRIPIGVEEHAYIIMPFIKGGTFVEYFSDTEQLPVTSERRILQLQKVIELAYFLKNLFAVGLFNDGLSGLDVMFRKKDLKLIMIDYGDLVAVTREGQVHRNFIDLLHMAFPELFSEEDYRQYNFSLLLPLKQSQEFNMQYLKHKIKQRGNKRIDKKVYGMIKKILIEGYFDKNNQNPFNTRVQAAVQIFIDDLEDLLQDMQSRAGED